MKRLLVEQLGNVQVEAARTFVVEVPDHFAEEQTEELLHDVDQRLPGTEGMEWRGDGNREWVGFDVDVVETSICEADSVETEKVKVIKLHDFPQDSARDE